ncbi:MAG: hypothetical protein ACT4NY_31370 [Pseudonocardiales bacterium]
MHQRRSALTRDLKAAIAAHLAPAIYAEVTDMLNSVDDTLQTFSSLDCAIDAVPSVAELCAAQGGIFAVEMGVVEDELKKTERIGG